MATEKYSKKSFFPPERPQSLVAMKETSKGGGPAPFDRAGPSRARTGEEPQAGDRHRPSSEALAKGQERLAEEAEMQEEVRAANRRVTGLLKVLNPSRNRPAPAQAAAASLMMTGIVWRLR